ncbi:MAG: peptide chain release factor 2 [Candidatus Kerfeldbacteria bacterium]|nr:peptide chain release factor 2 [Candidatus Kerfeldbacteria bacterium]
MKELLASLEELQSKIERTWKLLDLDHQRDEMKSLEFEMAEPDFWSDPDRAKAKSKRHDEIQRELDQWERIRRDVEETKHLAGDSIASGDHSLADDITKRLAELEQSFTSLEFYLMLSDRHDTRNAIVAIHAGTGGVDAQDWAAMLLRMYLRYIEKKGWTARVVDESAGQEAGIKSVTFEVQGRYAYGYLKAEAGVHRLVRISPFDAEKMRHTSFALVEVLPEFDDTDEIQIADKDLRIDTYMSSGKGGQSVNTTYSAVRIVHIPTGITVTCQNERSQQQNKATALKILKGKLHAIAQAEQQAEKQALRGEYQEAAWGNQVRSYVLQPYQLVKDHRTKYEEQDVNRVLDGGLDSFIEQHLRETIKRV